MKIRNYNRVENMQSRSDTDKILRVQRITSICGNQAVSNGTLAIVACIKKMVRFGFAHQTFGRERTFQAGGIM